MLKNTVRGLALSCVALLPMIGAAQPAGAQKPKAPSAKTYPTMAPIEQYLMDRNAEIALARTAVPASIAHDATIVVLGRHGYETAVQGKNGFLCYVGRGWTSAADPDYWNPRVRVPMCLNAPAVSSYWVMMRKVTDLALAGQNSAQVNAAIAAAVTKKELPPMAAGSLGYMLGKEGYGGDVAPHWPSHIMFFRTDVDPALWGANLPGSPMIAIADPNSHLTQFVVTAPKWSDGTDATPPAHHVHK